MAIEKYMIPCLNKKLFGVDCLGCGTQRALMLLLKGDFSGAFHMFPAIYTLLFLLLFLGLHIIDKSRSYHKIIIGLAIANAIIMIISYFYKMTNY
ncbi:DUF2752 domain-containing protein [Flavobacterium sp. GT3R68]|uniref:DUF2752 domain-containing protein n=1 Tax=Flavobacterium sp. GT3R68 TaxID=2594437 RepID=UPI000F87AF94|nr:DUF2752 domain-containing protein [Flavobacterium sp. GT3R68]RTY95389.1 DUF2752 domain-containing protein [Flavobacterium sp. GSN2]TRW91179.1 DUF2752 domain-containing protein [Flavobacterium sp. GT3R68]